MSLPARDLRSGWITTGDSVKLHYLEAGSGPPLLMVPGWSQAAEEFKHQLRDLSGRYRVIAVDMRGHGRSERPDFGYRISRLAADLKDVIDRLDLQDVNLLGHSSGCSVIWCYWDLFGPERLARLLLIDQMPAVLKNPAWGEQEIIDSGCVLDAESLFSMINTLRGPDGISLSRQFIDDLLTDKAPQELKDWIVACNLQLPREHAATMLLSQATQDWRDTIPRITLPTLVVSGRASFVPWRSCQWIHQQIKGSRFEIFEEEEGGQHFMFIENYKKFNEIVADFIE